MKYKIVIKCLIIISILLYAGRLFLANSVSTSGLTLDETNNEIAKYKLENDILNEKLLRIASLTSIASEAAKMGFVYGSEKITLSGPLPIAEKQ